MQGGIAIFECTYYRQSKGKVKKNNLETIIKTQTEWPGCQGDVDNNHV